MKFLFFAFLYIVSQSIGGQEYQYHINLKTIKNDQLYVRLTIPEIQRDTLIFYIPKTVPGTYSVCDYGRFISDMKAHYKNGEVLNIKPETTNSFIISNAKQIDSISYIVDDTWDLKIRKNKIFLPTGSNFEKDKVFLINNGALFGSFKGYENIPFNIFYIVPDSLEGFSSLNSIILKNQKVFTADNYKMLIDAPVLFTYPDTAKIYKKDTCEITIVVYHEKGYKIAEKIKPEIEKCISSIENFWDYLPIRKYTFLFYLFDYSDEYNALLKKQSLIKFWKDFKNIEAGALEHKQSSLYVLVDLGDKILTPVFEEFDYKGFLKEVIIHEYMHTITPIGLHSYEIGEIDFLNPQMSKHLWFYEGVTEYFANLIMLQNSMIDLEEFFNEIMKKNVIHAENFRSQRMSMVEMSENVLRKKYNKQYNYVYTYGALNALMLDLEIISLSEGKLTLKDIVKSLYEKYGYNSSFHDNEFLEEFLQLAPAGTNTFIEQFILGRKKPDYNEYLSKIGINFFESDSLYMPTIFSPRNGILDFKISNMALLTHGNIEIIATSSSSLLKTGDKLNIYELNNMMYNGITPKVNENDTIIINVKRNKYNFEVPLKVEFRKMKFTNVFLIQKSLTEDQLKIRNTWIGITNE